MNVFDRTPLRFSAHLAPPHFKKAPGGARAANLIARGHNTQFYSFNLRSFACKVTIAARNAAASRSATLCGRRSDLVAPHLSPDHLAPT